MAPLVLELQSRREFACRVGVTAQHREMLDGVLRCFGVTADYDLDIMAPNQTLTDITTRALAGLGRVYAEERPDLVLVHGDTSTTFAGALAAHYAQIPVGHVEAGLRTGDRYSPFPEEMNRRLTTQLAGYHFAPTARNAENLRREGVTEGVFVTGNTVIDAMRHTVGDGHFETPALRALDFEKNRVVVLTCHRRENYGSPMENIFAAVRDIAAAVPDALFVYPVHPSPAVKDMAARLLGNLPRVRLIEPLDAMEMHRLMARCHLVMTDSGGIQEEAPALGKPVLVLRRETERPEAIEAGTAALAGTERAVVRNLALTLLTDRAAYARMASAVNPYGDGHACPRIADAILYGFGRLDTPPAAFRP